MINYTLKKCIKCGFEKSLIDFPIRKDSKDGYRNNCKICENVKLNKWKKDNLEKNKKSRVIWYNNNRNKSNKYKNEWDKNKQKLEPLYKLKRKVRGIIKDGFRGNGLKKSVRTNEILGCSFEEFKSHLESKFESWMSWDNHGLYNGTEGYGWDIDHKIPISTAITLEDVIDLNHYSNLQPLCSKVNRDIKKANLNWSGRNI